MMHNYFVNTKPQRWQNLQICNNDLLLSTRLSKKDILILNSQYIIEFYVSFFRTGE